VRPGNIFSCQKRERHPSTKRHRRDQRLGHGVAAKRRNRGKAIKKNFRAPSGAAQLPFVRLTKQYEGGFQPLRLFLSRACGSAPAYGSAEKIFRARLRPGWKPGPDTCSG